MPRHGLATHMQSRPDQRGGYGQFRPFWGDVIPETSGPVRHSSSSPSPRLSPETHQGKIEAFLARCTVPRRGRGGDLFDLLLGRVGAGIVRVRHKIGRASEHDVERNGFAVGGGGIA